MAWSPVWCVGGFCYFPKYLPHGLYGRSVEGRTRDATGKGITAQPMNPQKHMACKVLKQSQPHP